VWSFAGKHYLYVDSIAASVQLHREAAQILYMAPSIAFTLLQTSAKNYSTVFHTLVLQLQLDRSSSQFFLFFSASTLLEVKRLKVVIAFLWETHRRAIKQLPLDTGEH